MDIHKWWHLMQKKQKHHNIMWKHFHCFTFGANYRSFRKNNAYVFAIEGMVYHNFEARLVELFRIFRTFLFPKISIVYCENLSPEDTHPQKLYVYTTNHSLQIINFTTLRRRNCQSQHINTTTINVDGTTRNNTTKIHELVHMHDQHTNQQEWSHMIQQMHFHHP